MPTVTAPTLTRVLLLAAAVALVLSGCSQASTPTATVTPTATPAPAAPAVPMDPALKARIDAIGQAAVAGGATGVVVGVHDPQRGDLLAAYGKADTAGTALTTDMHFRIAGVTRSFVATAILQLVDKPQVGQEQKLYLDDPVSKWLENIPNGAAVTLRNLLANRSGLYDFTADPGLAGRYAADPLIPGYTVDTGLTVLRAHATEFTPPGVRTIPNATDYLLLGYVLQKASGLPVARYVEDMARRGGLTQTTFPATPDLPKPFASGYVPAAGPAKDATRSNPLFPWADGAMISTVPDLLTYAGQVATGAGLSPATFGDRTAFNPAPSTTVAEEYGLGLARFGDWIGDSGAIPGYSDVVVHRPASNTSIVVMVNASDGAQVTALAPFAQIARALYPASAPA